MVKKPRIVLTHHETYRVIPVTSGPREARIVETSGTVFHPTSGSRFKFPGYQEKLYLPAQPSIKATHFLSSVMALEELEDRTRQKLQLALRELASKHARRCNDELRKYRKLESGQPAVNFEFSIGLEPRGHSEGNWTKVKLNARVEKNTSQKHRIQSNAMLRVVKKHFERFNMQVRTILESKPI